MIFLGHIVSQRSYKEKKRNAYGCGQWAGNLPLHFPGNINCAVAEAVA
jgi:hypothetical protein